MNDAVYIFCAYTGVVASLLFAFIFWLKKSDSKHQHPSS
jgi:hypothetical protein